MTELICPICKKEFRRNDSYMRTAAKHMQKIFYCSSQCAMKGRRKTIAERNAIQNLPI